MTCWYFDAFLNLILTITLGGGYCHHPILQMRPQGLSQCPGYSLPASCPAILHSSLPCSVPRRLNLAEANLALFWVDLAGSRAQRMEEKVRMFFSHSLSPWHQIPHSSCIPPWTAQLLAAEPRHCTYTLHRLFCSISPFHFCPNGSYGFPMLLDPRFLCPCLSSQPCPHLCK